MKSWQPENDNRTSTLSRASLSLAESKQQTLDQPCKHAELISYKVHKDQFKSLLVAPAKGKGLKQKMMRKKASKILDALQSKDSGKVGSGSGVSDQTKDSAR